MDLIGMFKNLENALDAASLRQQVIANNIANASAPGFQSQGVAFEDELKKAMDDKDASEGLGGMRAVSLDEEDGDFRIGGNRPEDVRAKVFNTGQNADMNKEMVNLSKNQIHYNMLADKLGGFMGAVQMVIDNTGK
ncbi:MAG: flagellar basal body rod protein FlgB [Candidatus Eremiobacteraeota bacterium]|nr:flagellar basal body rod protein FlgB [Candidatus Eremiobacteraeota bacterium]